MHPRLPQTSRLGPILAVLLVPACSGDLAAPPDHELSASVVPASSTTFGGFVFGCSSTAPEELRQTPGGTRHFTGAGNVNQWLADDPRVTGFEYNRVSAMINFNNGLGRAHGTGRVEPDGIDGYWDIAFLVKVGESATGVGHGRGDLEGLTMRFTLYPGQDVPNPCTANMPFRAKLEGVIVAPAAR